MKTRKEVAEYVNSGKCVDDADEKYKQSSILVSVS